MKFTPHPYQQILIDHTCERSRVGLWAGMGMGKTVAALTAISHLDLVLRGPVLVLAPLRVAQSTWPDEARQWDHLGCLRVEPIVGDVAQRRAALKRDANVFTMNYENLPWLFEELAGRPFPFRMVIPDESTRLKGYRIRQGTKRAKQLGKVAHTQVDHWANLTGTPAPNGLIDLWGQTWFLDAGERLGRTFDAFKQRWFITRNERGAWAKNPEFKIPVTKPVEWAQEEIETRLKDICISIRPEDWFDLEKPIVREVPVELPRKARALYQDMKKRMFMELAGCEIEAVNAAVKTIKCLQIASGAAFTDDEGTWAEIHDEKLSALESIAEEWNGEPILVAYHWKPSLQRLLKAFPKARLLDKKPETLAAWNRGEIPMMFAHPQSAGHGLSLQHGGRIIVHFDQWWSLEEHDQINERLGPMRQRQSGYQRSVFNYYLVAKDTEDERVMLRRETKRSVQSLLMEAVRAEGYL